MSDSDSKRVYKAVSMSGQTHRVELDELEVGDEELIRAAEQAESGGEAGDTEDGEPESLLVMLRQRLGDEAVELVDEVITEEIQDFRRAKLERAEREAEQIRAEAEEKLAAAEREAEQIVAEAEEQAEQIEQRAKEKIQQQAEEARQQAAEEAREDVRREQERVLEKLETVPERVEDRISERLDELAPQLTELGLQVGEVLCGAELSQSPGTMVETLRGELAELNSEEKITLHLAPRLHDNLEASDLLSEVRDFLHEEESRIRVERDGDLTGGYRITGPDLAVDRTHERVLDELRRVTGLDEQSGKETAPSAGEPDQSGQDEPEESNRQARA